ncbi:PREDICTED: sialin-like, partial [Rhagoletis zephyria]|uniref:sialin-like n=1 Tax=Rhagoletis zephyria TaxID=28612 RepID=UPI0008116B43
MVRHPDKAAGQQQLVHSSNSSLTVEPEPELELDTPLSSTQSPRLLENPDLHLEMSSGKHTGEFDWSEKTQGLVLGAFFWGYVVLQLPGGQMETKKKERVVIPWRDILTSVPVWALTITHFGQHWGFYTMLTQLPRYFKELGFDLRSNGYYSALPQAITSSSVGFLCDRLLASGRFRLATLRKTFNSIAFFGTAFCLYLITLTERHRGANIALLTAALGVNGIGMAGFTVTHVDLSPRFAGTLMGMTNFVANFAGVLVPLL